MRQRRPKATMVCPKCGAEQVLYVYPQAVTHRCPSNGNKWVNFVEVEQEEE